MLPAGMNLHHLELFYYVCLHGGISAAVRHIPYGIQQPAVSGQMRQLEEDVGTKLFERSPFRLTAAGQRLFVHLRPFFEDLEALGERLRAEARPELRLGGAELVLRDHVPAVMRRVRAHHPSVRLSLRPDTRPRSRNGSAPARSMSRSPRSESGRPRACAS